MTKKPFGFAWLAALFGGGWACGADGGGFLWRATGSSATQNRNHGTHLVNAKLNNVLFLLPCLLAKYIKKWRRVSRFTLERSADLHTKLKGSKNH